jgi:glycerophosphoryl diester phosphodiesterase
MRQAGETANQDMKINKQCFFKTSARWLCIILLFSAGMMAGGCALSPATKCLGEVLEREIGSENDEYARYRCTAGAHRGDSIHYTENTLAALKAANDDTKYAFVEFDVQYSEDGKIVVFHDSRLLRIFGSLRAIGKTLFEKLVEVTDGEIASYEAVMDVLNDKKINIEIKSQGDPDEDERLVDEIIADIIARDRKDDVMISAISPDVIRYISRTYPDIRTGQIFWLTASTYLHFDPLTERLYTEIADTQADYLMLHVANLRNIDSLIKLKPHDKTIVFWDFDDAIYVVHKNFSDRLWGHSGIRAMYENIRYMFFLPFYCHTPDA